MTYKDYYSKDSEKIYNLIIKNLYSIFLNILEEQKPFNNSSFMKKVFAGKDISDIENEKLDELRNLSKKVDICRVDLDEILKCKKVLYESNMINNMEKYI